MSDKELLINLKADKKVFSNEVFKISEKIEINSFSAKSDLVPEIDKDYIFDEKTNKVNFDGS